MADVDAAPASLCPEVPYPWLLIDGDDGAFYFNEETGEAQSERPTMSQDCAHQPTLSPGTSVGVASESAKASEVLDRVSLLIQDVRNEDAADAAQAPFATSSTLRGSIRKQMPAALKGRHKILCEYYIEAVEAARLEFMAGVESELRRCRTSLEAAVGNNTSYVGSAINAWDKAQGAVLRTARTEIDKVLKLSIDYGFLLFASAESQGVTLDVDVLHIGNLEGHVGCDQPDEAQAPAQRKHQAGQSAVRIVPRTSEDYDSIDSDLDLKAPNPVGVHSSTDTGIVTTTVFETNARHGDGEESAQVASLARDQHGGDKSSSEESSDTSSVVAKKRVSKSAKATAKNVPVKSKEKRERSSSTSSLAGKKKKRPSSTSSRVGRKKRRSSSASPRVGRKKRRSSSASPRVGRKKRLSSSASPRVGKKKKRASSTSSHPARKKKKGKGKRSPSRKRRSSSRRKRQRSTSSKSSRPRRRLKHQKAGRKRSSSSSSSKRRKKKTSPLRKKTQQEKAKQKGKSRSKSERVGPSLATTSKEAVSKQPVRKQTPPEKEKTIPSASSAPAEDSLRKSTPPVCEMPSGVEVKTEASGPDVRPAGGVRNPFHRQGEPLRPSQFSVDPAPPPPDAAPPPAPTSAPPLPPGASPPAPQAAAPAASLAPQPVPTAAPPQAASIAEALPLSSAPSAQAAQQPAADPQNAPAATVITATQATAPIPVAPPAAAGLATAEAGI